MSSISAVAISVECLQGVLVGIDSGESWSIMPKDGNTYVTLDGDGHGNVTLTITEPDW